MSRALSYWPSWSAPYWPHSRLWKSRLVRDRPFLSTHFTEAA